MTEIIVMRAWTASSPGGQVIEPSIGIEKPIQQGPWLWNCAINFGTIPHLPRAAMGVDFWQAAQLAMLMVHAELVVKQYEGWSFSFFNG